MAIEQLPIICHYNKQRFIQYCPQDAANWYITPCETGKRPQAMYPTMGRKHIRTNGINRLIFTQEPRVIFKSIDYMYVVVGAQLYQVNSSYTLFPLNNPDFQTTSSAIWSTFLTVGSEVYVCFTDGVHVYVITESTKAFQTLTPPPDLTKPTYIASFGNRIVVSQLGSPVFYLSNINLTATNPNDGFSLTQAFTGPNGIIFAQASGRIGQLAVLHNQLYIFNDFTTDIWMNVPSVFQNATFPWKINTSYAFDYGIADPESLDIDFSMMTWLGQNRNGLVAFLSCNGQMPQSISTPAINVLIQNTVNNDVLSPFLSTTSDGFMYQYEDTRFYRASAGTYIDSGILDNNNNAHSIEFNFETQTWHRCIELNGDRNRIQQHVYFNNKHLVTVQGDPAIYEMAGNIYYNELRNTNQDNPQAADAFIAYPFRYELVTQIISQPDYSEFITEYVQIDFVWGDMTFIKSDSPFSNTVFLVTEESTETTPVYIVSEDGLTYLIQDGTNTPSINEQTYNALFKPHIELYFSDDGGISFQPADVEEFSQLGIYSWRMRWYQLGLSRNRCYQLVCVSPAPIVILGGNMDMRRSSGGAN